MKLFRLEVSILGQGSKRHYIGRYAVDTTQAVLEFRMKHSYLTIHSVKETIEY